MVDEVPSGGEPSSPRDNECRYTRWMREMTGTNCG